MLLPKRLGALLSLLALATCACAQDAYTLRYRALPQALKYRTLEVSVIVVMRAGEEPRSTRTERGAIELYRAKEQGASLLDVAVDTLSVTCSRDGVATPAPAVGTAHRVIDLRGFTRDPQGHETVASPLALILPEPELKLGPAIFGVRGLGESSETVTSEPSPPIPVRVPVVTKVAGIVQVGDRTCVRLEQSARVSQKLAGDTRLYEYVLRGWSLFDPALGAVIESSIEERVDDAVLPPPRTGQLRRRRETVRTSKLY